MAKTEATKSLEAAIRQLDEARKEDQALKDAQARARANLDEAERRLAAASAAVDEAKERHAQGFLASASGGGAAPSSSGLRAARAAETEARDEVEAAQAAVAKFDAALEYERSSLTGHVFSPVTNAEKAVTEAVGVVVRERVNVPKMIATMRAARQAAYLASIQLTHVAGRDWVSPSDKVTIAEAFSDLPITMPHVKHRLNSINQPIYEVYNYHPDNVGGEAWEKAFIALHTAPDTRLPDDIREGK